MVLSAALLLQQWLLSGTAFSDDALAVWVFDVGQGDAIFIDAPGAQVLIDGGPSSDIVEHLTRVMPPWDRSIDVVINTHPHADHVTGLVSVLERYDVGEVWVSGQSYRTDVVSYFDSLAPQRAVGQGDEIDLGSGAHLEVLWPPETYNGAYLDDPNAGSIVALLTYGEVEILLTGDIGVEEELALLDQLGDIDVLKVGHQGSLTSTHPTFLEQIRPEYALISVGENDYGHPSPVVLGRLADAGASVFRTDLHGSLRVLLNGVTFDVRSFRY